MKLNCGKSADTKRKEKGEWHDWYAWHPVRLGGSDCRWLEVVERRVFYYAKTVYWKEYRAKEARK